MKDNKMNKDTKRGFPGFLVFLIAVILIILSVQSFNGDKFSKIAFSHQVEHLVNLDLIKPDTTKKISQNDNLVTFTAKFRDNLTQDAQNRYNYLALLDKKFVLDSELNNLSQELSSLEKLVKKSAEVFLSVAGLVPVNGHFEVVAPSFDTFDRQNSIEIDSIPKKDGINLRYIKDQLTWVKYNASQENLKDIIKNFNDLIDIYLSSNIGIGDETIKQKIKDIKKSISSFDNNVGLNQQMTILSNSLVELDSITQNILEVKNGVSLLPLRSVRSYVETIDKYNLVRKDIDANILALDNAREKVALLFWYFDDKELSTKQLEKQDFDTFSRWFLSAKKEWDNFENNKNLLIKAPDQPRNLVLEKMFKSQEPTPNYLNYLFTILPIVIVVLLLYFLFSRQMKGVGSSAMNFGKSPARLLTKEANHVTFKDVAGCEEAKEELEEIVDFLKDPQKFTNLGARIPKGVLLVGPPGTGKTLVAKAVAGEADRPFYSISGSDFVEMFVGVGASRVRDLFDQAKRNAPCIIFMDEIDAVGRHRGAGIGGGHDEREQTLNQLLVEMDGFDTKEGVILMAATNRPDILDKALLRPGRFDRRVVLDLPDVKGRYEILKVHARRIKIDSSVDLMDIARITPGASGADLENILNESALLAARKGRKAVTSQETAEACDKVRFGKERRSLDIDETEKKTTAYHESGHAIVGLVVKNADPVDKVTIIPRGFSLGATHFMPKKNRLNYWKKEALDQLAIMMGGRSAEEVFLDDMSSGAQQDIAQATKLARAMICEWGMSSNLGTVTYDDNNGNQYLGLQGYQERAYSDETAKMIDSEVKNLLGDAHQRAISIINENKDKLVLMANMLMEFETLDKQDVKEIIDGTWDAEKKRKRMKLADDLQKKLPPPQPKKSENQEGISPQEA